MLRTHRPASIVVVIALILATGSLSAAASPPTGDPAAPTPRATAHAPTDAVRSVVAQADTTHQHGDDAPSPEELVSHMQELLSHHATLAIRLTRATLTEDPDFVDAAEGALVRNVGDIESALAPAVGAEAAEQLSSQWERQTQALFQFAASLRDDDADAMTNAMEQLDSGIEEQASLLAELSGGDVDQGEVADALRRHFERQIDQLKAYGAEDYGQAYDLQRTAFAETFPLGATMARTTVDVPEPTPTAELQTSLAMLLGEHVELAIDTMRTGATGAADFEAAAAALDANTRDVTGAMDALFGAEQAQSFNEVWADHIDLFVDYTVAVVEDDAETKQTVRDEFDGVMRRFGVTLAEATGGQVDADVVADAMGQHEAQLVDQIEQYADADFSGAHQASYTAYQHIRHVADVLAVSFADAVITDMPKGGSQTGGGGTAAW